MELRECLKQIRSLVMVTFSQSYQKEELVIKRLIMLKTYRGTIIQDNHISKQKLILHWMSQDNLSMIDSKEV